MREAPEGEYVLATDYYALRAERGLHNDGGGEQGQ